MKNEITKALVGLGTGLSAVYLVVFALFLVADHIHGGWFRNIQGIGILGLLVSPLACVMIFAGLLCVFFLQRDIRSRLVLMAITEPPSGGEEKPAPQP
jgi:hypothetical protein